MISGKRYGSLFSLLLQWESNVVKITLSDFPGKPVLVATLWSSFITVRVKIKIGIKPTARYKQLLHVCFRLRPHMSSLYTRLRVGQLYSVRWPWAQRLNGGKMFRKATRLSGRTAVLLLLGEKHAKLVITGKKGPNSYPPTWESDYSFCVSQCSWPWQPSIHAA